MNNKPNWSQKFRRPQQPRKKISQAEIETGMNSQKRNFGSKFRVQNIIVGSLFVLSAAAFLWKFYTTMNKPPPEMNSKDYLFLDKQKTKKQGIQILKQRYSTTLNK